MTVSVAGKLLNGINDLSEVGRMVLRFIDGGQEWLAWAVGNPSVRRSFSDEAELVAAVQFELHASRLALLPQLGLSVSPVKLMTLSLADLRTLARAEGGDDSPAVSAQVQRILADNGLATQSDLALGAALLNQLGVGNAPVFQILDFEDRLALYELARIPGDEDSPLRQEAAEFAVTQARTPLEFADYYRFYLAHARKLDPLPGSPGLRLDKACSALQTLLPLLFGHLGGPELPGLSSPSEVAAALHDWFAKGGQVGFSRISEGARLIMERTRYPDETGVAAQELVNRYLSEANALISSCRPAIGRLNQDGSSIALRMDSGSRGAELKTGSAGTVCLSDFLIRPTASRDDGASPA